MYNKKLQARDLWIKILDSQMETGTPYLLYKDAANIKSNQKNLGTIKSSNLCTEIIEYSDANETAVCNLASIGLTMFVNDDKTFNYSKLYHVSQVLVENLNNIIDINFYPTIKTMRSNFKHRPIGIGVQGLADVFIKMNLPFCSNEAKEINKKIFETIYYAALEKSNKISQERCEEMLYLQQEYGCENWSFIEDDENNKFRKYNIYNVTEASIGAAINTDNKIDELLNKHKPIKDEIENLNDNFIDILFYWKSYK